MASETANLCLRPDEGIRMGVYVFFLRASAGLEGASLCGVRRVYPPISVFPSFPLKKTCLRPFWFTVRCKEFMFYSIKKCSGYLAERDESATFAPAFGKEVRRRAAGSGSGAEKKRKKILPDFGCFGKSVTFAPAFER